MLSKRKAIGWHYDEQESQSVKRIKDHVYEAIENELDHMDSGPSALVIFDDELTLLEKIKKCRFVIDPLYNDQNILSREITYSLISAVMHASP